MKVVPADVCDIRVQDRLPESGQFKRARFYGTPDKITYLSALHPAEIIRIVVPGASR